MIKTITYNPETHVLVPIDPSEDMFRSMTDGSISINGDNRSQFNSGYDSMLAAAPQPEPVDSEPIGWFKFDKVSKCWHPQYDKYAATYAELEGWKQLYATPQPNPTAELEAALKAARDGIDEFLVANDPTEFGCACDLSVGYLCGPCHADKQQQPLKRALAKINEVLK